MKHILTLISLLLGLPTLTVAQGNILTISSKVNVDIGLQQNIEVFQLQEPLNLWINFLSAENDISGASYWNQNEVIKFGRSDYFQLNDIDYFELGDKIKSLQQGTTVLSISKKDSLYKITSQFQVRYNDSVSLTPFIFHVYAQIDSQCGALKLYNPFPINLKQGFQKSTFKNITYYYPSNANFDKSQAKKQQAVLVQIQKEFNIPMGQYDFVLTDNRDSYYSLFGYDFHFQNVGLEFPSGKADTKQNIVYSYGSGFYYPHELIHLMINNKWNASHLWFVEGFATFFGQSRGQDLKWHLERINEWLKANPGYDINNLLELKNLDDRTSFHYALGGLFIKMAYEKGGPNLVCKLMESGNSDDAFYNALNNYLGISRNEINNFLRRELNRPDLFSLN